MENIKIEIANNKTLDFKVVKKFKRLVCVRDCNAMSMKTRNFKNIELGTIIYDAVLNEVGSFAFKLSIHGEYYIISNSSFFSACSQETLNKISKIKELKIKYRRILDDINLIESGFESVY